MNSIPQILQETAHRPWEMPVQSWSFYQEWNNAVFLHWPVDLNLLREVVPVELEIDTFDGKDWISIVAFTMQEVRPRNFPSLKFISDFHEINLRTYVKKADKAGVFFLNIEAEKFLSVIIARNLSLLAYEKSEIVRNGTKFNSKNKSKAFFLDLQYAIGNQILKKEEIDRWLTERYCLYVENKSAIYRYDIHHKPWPLNKLELEKLYIFYRIGDIILTAKPVLTHYSAGVKVIAWQKVKI